MHCGIRSHFGMERRSKSLALSNQHRIRSLRRQDFHPLADPHDLRGTDENHFEWLLTKLALTDRTLHLPPVGVAANTDVERIQPGLWRVFHLASQQNASCTRPERWLVRDEMLKLRESLRAQQFEERARLPARKDKPVQAIEMRGIADERDLRTELLEADAVRVKIALQSQNSDSHADLILMDNALVSGCSGCSPLAGANGLRCSLLCLEHLDVIQQYALMAVGVDFLIHPAHDALRIDDEGRAFPKLHTFPFPLRQSEGLHEP
jgi:hypothetical protein